MARQPEFLTRIRAIWLRISTSMWSVPTVLTLAAIGLAFFTLRIDRDLIFQKPDMLLLGGSAEAARSVLGVIAGSIITVTGVVFSVTIVALQLASTQFTPRILRSFTTDRGNQIVLGVFIGTFTYAIIVQRVVIAPGERATDFGFVPTFSVTVAVALALVSIACLIYFIDHAAKSIQASTIIERVYRDTLRIIDRLYPQRLDEASDGLEQDIPELPPLGQAVVLTAQNGGYLQGVDHDELVDVARRHDLLLHVEPTLGEYVPAGGALALLWHSTLDDEIAHDLRAAFFLGNERTPEQDVERGLVELADIAIKALSPGINDPNTALIAIDRIADALAHLGNRAWPDAGLDDADGTLRVVTHRPSFETVVDGALDQIRHFAADQPTVIGYLISRIGRIGRLVPAPRRAALMPQLRASLDAARRIGDDPFDLARVERLGDAAWRALRSTAPRIQDGARDDVADPHTPGTVAGADSGQGPGTSL